MGLWKSHRQRQAGKYAKRTYRVERARFAYEVERDRAWAQTMQAIRAPQARDVLVRDVKVQRALPPRPDAR